MIEDAGQFDGFATLHEAIAAYELELKRRSYLLQPDGPRRWIEERLGDFVWSKQREILAALQANRRIAVPSCYASGKSWLAARIAAYWIDVHAPGDAFVITTATTGAQVKAILWRELGRAWAQGRLPGRLNQTEWWLPCPARDPLTGDVQRNDDGSVRLKEEIVAFGRKPADFDPTAFQGIHQRYVLVVVDEAAGVPITLLNAAEGLIVNANSRMLLIGNPEDATGGFARACEPGSGWAVVRIPAWSTPNFTGEYVPDILREHLISKLWVEEKRKSWTETSPLWTAKIEAEFPSSQDDSLIPIAWVRQAQERTLPASAPTELGVDVGGGGDKNVIAVRRGPVVRIVKRDKEPDTMKSLGNVIGAMRLANAGVAKVDKVGIGRGLCDRATEQGRPIVGINVGEKSTDPEAFANLRAEYYWGLRERFRTGDIDIDAADEDLVGQLVALRFKRNSRGQIQIESKDDMKRRGLSSPDEADAVMLAFATPRDRGPAAAVILPGHETVGGPGRQSWQDRYFRRSGRQVVLPPAVEPQAVGRRAMRFTREE